MLVCPHCHSFIDIWDSHCSSCQKEHVYYVDNHPYSYQQVCSRLESDEWTGFTIVVREDGSMIPLHRHRNFIRYFLERKIFNSDDSTATVAASEDNQNVSKEERKIGNKIFVDKSSPIFVFLSSLALLLMVIFLAKEKTQIFESKNSYPPSKFQEYIQISRVDRIGLPGFPKEGDIKFRASSLQSSFYNWKGEDVGEFLLSATLSDEKLPTDFPLWLSWAQDVYPQNSSVRAAKASWLFRYSLFIEGCSLATDCTHEACLAMSAACKQTENSLDPSSYLARYSLVYRLGNGHTLEKSLFDYVPSQMALSLKGDLAIAKGDFSEGLRFYESAKNDGADVIEELILTYALLRDFTQVEKLLSQKGSIDSFSPRTLHIIVRSLIELKKIPQALELLKKTPESLIKELQKNHLASIIGKPIQKDFSCNPKNAGERLYCARVYIMRGQYNEAISIVDSLSLGDPTKSLIKLLVAMRKGDGSGMDKAIQNFAYVPSNILSIEHPQTAYVPSISLEEIELLLREYVSSVETKAILKWSFVRNPSVLIDVDVVSAPICSALLLYALEEKKYDIAEENLQCLGFFEVQDHFMNFYRSYTRAQRHPDIYPNPRWKEFLEKKSSRSYWYWYWSDKRTIDSFNNMHELSSPYFSFGTRWFEEQDGYAE